MLSPILVNLVAFFLHYGVYIDDYACPTCQSNRGRIVDDVDFNAEFYIDSRASMSDAEDA